MAKRERDGWRVVADRDGSFMMKKDSGVCDVFRDNGGLYVYASGATLTPARARQFAEKLLAIAERAEKGGGDGR